MSGRSSEFTDLALGMRMSVSGGRSGWARLAFIAVGTGLGVLMLLLVASLPAVLDARAVRDAARQPGPQVSERGDGTVLVEPVWSLGVGDEHVAGLLLQPEGPDAPLPPGADRVLAPGEALLSPALLRLLEGPQGDLLEGRWGERVVGTIGPDGLVGPQDLRYYLGTDLLTAETATRVESFGRSRNTMSTDSAAMLMALVGVTGLLVPVSSFVAASVRFGGEARDRRLAAVRLVGADTATTHRIAAGETLVGALGGLVVGTGLFALVRAVVPPLVPPSFSFHGADLTPAPVLAALVALLVPVASVLVTRAALRSVVVEPLGVVRRAAERRRRVWWRLVVPALGAALMVVPLLGDGYYRNEEQPVVLAGMVLLLVGVILLLPWLVEVVVHRLPPGGLAWDLTLRRLQLDGGTAVRAVSAVVVSVASAVAVYGLLGSDQAPPGPSSGRFEATVRDDLPTSDGAHWVDVLAATPGVLHVDEVSRMVAGTVPDGEEAGITVTACARVEAVTGVEGCTDGDTVVVVTAGLPAPAPGTTYLLGEPGSGAATWTLPADAVTVESSGPAPYDSGLTEVYVTPGALGEATLERSDAAPHTTVVAALDPRVPDAAEHLRTAVGRTDPTAWLTIDDPAAVSPMYVATRRGLLIGTVLLLSVVGASLVVNAAEQLRERRRPLAVLAAFGVRRRTLGLSVLLQVAVPVVLGLLTAVVVGGGTALALQSGSGRPLSLDWQSIGLITGGAVGVVLLATAAILPLLGRVTHPAGLQGE